MSELAERLPAISHGRFRRRRGSRGWLLIAGLLAAITLLPVVVVIASFAQIDAELWQHMSRHVLPRVSLNTLWMVTGVALGSLVLGTALGWLTAVCDFPGRRFFSWALLLPMAMPGYVMATALLGLADFNGPLHQLLQYLFGSQASAPRFRHLGGLVLVLTLTLYPYVYLLARNAFMSQGARSLEVGQSLGLSRMRSFVRISLPLARPWLAAGTLLVVMEAMADFGTVAVFNYDTFTLAIYHAWYGMFSIQSALQLSGVLILVVLLVMTVEQRLRGRSSYTAQFAGVRDEALVRLSGARRWGAFAVAATVFLAAFVVPATQLLAWAIPNFVNDFDARYMGFAFNSLVLAVMGAALVTGLGVVLAYAVRLAGHPLARALARIATLGYALPGTVLAVGVFVPVAWFSDSASSALVWLFGDATPRLVLQGTLFAMLLAYCIRFLAVAHGPVGSQLERVTRSVDEAARGLGVSGMRLLRRVHLPILRRGLITAAVFAFVDIMKELPITLMTRPFGWDTLATRVYQMTTEGEWERAALPALAIVVVGLVPVVLLLHQSDRRRA